MIHNNLYNLENLPYRPPSLEARSEQGPLRAALAKAETVFSEFSNFYNVLRKSLVYFVESSRFPKLPLPQVLQIDRRRIPSSRGIYLTSRDIPDIFNEMYPCYSVKDGICYGFAFVGKDAILRRNLKGLDKRLLKLNDFLNIQPKESSFEALSEAIQKDQNPDNLNFFKDLAKAYRAPSIPKGEALLGSFSGCYTKEQLKKHLKSLELLILRLKIR